MTARVVHAFVMSVLMLATVLCCYCTVELIGKLDPPAAPVAQCPSREQCWNACVSLAGIAAEQAKHTCTTSVDNMALLRECDDQLFELRADVEDHCSARIDAMFQEMYWEYRDQQFDEWDANGDGTTDGGGSE